MDLGIIQRGCSVSLLGAIQKTLGQGPGQVA